MKSREAALLEDLEELRRVLLSTVGDGCEHDRLQAAYEISDQLDNLIVRFTRMTLMPGKSGTDR